MKLSAVILMQSQCIVNKYNFTYYRPIGHLSHTIQRLEEFQADEIILLNRGHTENPYLDFISVFKKNSNRIALSTPLAYGGGIRTLQQVEKLIDAGVERVVLSIKQISTDLTTEIANKFGEQSILFHLPFQYQDCSLIFRGADLNYDCNSLVQALKKSQGSEIILTSISAEGSGEFNVEIIRKIIEVIPKKFNIIYNGGVSSINQFNDLLNLGLNGVGLGNVLNSKELFIPLLKNTYNKFLRNFDAELVKHD